jgi:hypothetical protein
MKTQSVILTTSIMAVTDLAARRLVGFDGNVCASGAKALGVIDAETAADSMAPANVLGVILVEAGAALTAGSEIQSDATGRAIVKSTGAGNGFAWDAATAAGDMIRIVRGI